MQLEKGQKVLLDDLQDLMNEVRKGEFGDFSNNKYPAPKIALMEKFGTLKTNVMNGKYD